MTIAGTEERIAKVALECGNYQGGGYIDLKVQMFFFFGTNDENSR